jgi:hypothetical protein
VGVEPDVKVKMPSPAAKTVMEQEIVRLAKEIEGKRYTPHH